MTDYKKYALGQLENFLHDCMNAETTAQEIYDVIKSVVEDNYYTYKNSASQAYELLALLNGNGVGHLTCGKDDTSEECKKSWNDFWEEPNQYTDEELDAMCDGAVGSSSQIPISNGGNGGGPTTPDKVVKWQLPVQRRIEDGVDDYFVQFPDDLLEAANLRKGDTVEWVDQGDGSYLLRKVDGII
jgi:hypothetical protein